MNPGSNFLLLFADTASIPFQPNTRIIFAFPLAFYFSCLIFQLIVKRTKTFSPQQIIYANRMASSTNPEYQQTNLLSYFFRKRF